MIEPKQAKKIAESATGVKFLTILDFPSFYGFCMGKNSGGSITTVNKQDGRVGTFFPPDDFALYKRAKEIKLNNE